MRIYVLRTSITKKTTINVQFLNMEAQKFKIQKSILSCKLFAGKNLDLNGPHASKRQNAV